jgi:hypothetical protein
MAGEKRLSPREVHEAFLQPFGFRAPRYSNRGSARGAADPLAPVKVRSAVTTHRERRWDGVRISHRVRPRLKDSRQPQAVLHEKWPPAFPLNAQDVRALTKSVPRKPYREGNSTSVAQDNGCFHRIVAFSVGWENSAGRQVCLEFGPDLHWRWLAAAPRVRP